LRESGQNRAKDAIAKDAGRKSRPQRGVEGVLWQAAGKRQVDLELPENGPEFPKTIAWLGRRVSANRLLLQLPTQEQFGKLVNTIRDSDGGWGERCADLAEFLANSGCQKGEAAPAGAESI
jgi:hypothetical protein